MTPWEPTAKIRFMTQQDRLFLTSQIDKSVQIISFDTSPFTISLNFPLPPMKNIISAKPLSQTSILILQHPNIFSLADATQGLDQASFTKFFTEKKVIDFQVFPSGPLGTIEEQDEQCSICLYTPFDPQGKFSPNLTQRVLIEKFPIAFNFGKDAFYLLQAEDDLITQTVQF